MQAAPHRDALSAHVAELAIPDHVVLKCIGTGSYGRVFLAKSFLGEFRAVKVISRKALKDHGPFDRELRGIREFEPISRSHSGFLNILHAGQDSTGDYFYYVMELADDASGSPCTDTERYEARSLHRVLQTNAPLPLGDIVRFGVCLTDALQHLHEAGLVHRDIKPANILFVGGMPKFGDIGLVAQEALAESLVGTIGYIPPEGPGTRQADIFALGKVLYECLTGLDRTRFPEMPSLVDGHPESRRFLELNEVVLKACHPKPDERYSSARAMHVELQAIQNGKSVLQMRRFERVAALWKRAGTMATAAAAVLIGTVLVVQAVQRRHHQGKAAQAHLEAAVRAVDGGDYLSALDGLAAKVEASQGSADENIDRLRFAATLGQLPKLTLVKALGASLTWCEFTPDDQAILVATANGRAELRSTETGEKLTEFVGHTNAILSAAISGNGAWVATAGEDARLWEAHSGRQVGLLPHSSRVTVVRFHPTSDIVITASSDGRLRWWNRESGALIHEVEAHSASIGSIAVSRDGQWVVSGGRDGKVRFWNSEAKQAGEPLVHSKQVLHVDLSADGASLLATCEDHSAYLWDLRTRTRIGSPLQHAREVGQGAFSKLGRRVLTCGWDGTLQLWDAKTGSREGPPLKHALPVTCADYSHDSRRIASGCTDGTLRVWDLAGRNLPERLAIVALSPNGHHYTWTNGGTIEVRSSQSSNASAKRITPDLPSVPIGVNDSATLVAVVARSEDGSSMRFRLWDTTAGTGIGQWAPIPRMPTQCIFAAGRSTLALSDSNLLHLVNATSGELRTLELADRIRELSFSSDGRWLAVASATNVHVLAANTGAPRYPPLPHSAKVSHVEFSPGADRLVSCTSDGSLNSCYAQVWDASSGRPVGAKLWHRDGVRDAVWFPNGKVIATASEDGTARSWNVQTSRQTRPEVKHLKQAVDIDLRGDRLLLTSGWDKTLRISDASTGMLIGPPVGFSYALDSAKWLPENSGILVRVLGGVTWLQKLKPVTVKAALLLQLADVLNARQPTQPGQDPFEASQSLERNWRSLKATVPSWFSVSSDEIVAWCWTESSRSRASNRSAEEQHFMDRILTLRPDDPLAPLVKKWAETKQTDPR